MDAIGGGFGGAAAVAKPGPETTIPAGAWGGEISLYAKMNSILPMTMAATLTRYRMCTPSIAGRRCHLYRNQLQ